MRFLLFIILVVNVSVVADYEFILTNASSQSLNHEIVAEELSKAHLKLNGAFNATVDAELAGANIELATKKLNQALDFINQAETQLVAGNLDQAYALLSDAISLSEETMLLADDLKEQAIMENHTLRIVAGIGLVAIAIGCSFIGWFWWKRRLKKVQGSSDKGVVR